MFSLKIST